MLIEGSPFLIAELLTEKNIFLLCHEYIFTIMHIFLNIFSDIKQTTANVCNITITLGIWQSLPANFSGPTMIQWMTSHGSCLIV